MLICMMSPHGYDWFLYVHPRSSLRGMQTVWRKGWQSCSVKIKQCQKQCQSLGIGPAPWHWTLFCCSRRPSSCFEHVSISSHSCPINIGDRENRWSSASNVNRIPGQLAPWTTLPIKIRAMTFRPIVISPHRQFALWTTRPMDNSPQGHLASWTTRPMKIRPRIFSPHVHYTPRTFFPVIDYGRIIQ